MKKMTVLILILVASLFNLSYATQMSSGEQLKVYGIIDGDKNENLNIEDEMTRAELYKILIHLMDKEEEVQDISFEGMPFEDVEKNMWYAKYIAYAFENGLTNGVSEHRFEPDVVVDQQVVATVLLRYLGYMPEWDNAIKLAEEKGIETTVKENFNRGNAFDMILCSLNVVSKNTKEKGIENYTSKVEEKASVKIDSNEPTFKCLVTSANNNFEVIFYFEEAIKTVASKDAFIFSDGLEAKDFIIDFDNPKKVRVFLDKEKGTLKDREYEVTLDSSKIISVTGKMLESNTKLELKGKTRQFTKIHLYSAHFISNKGIVAVFDDAISEPKKDMSLYKLRLDGEVVNPIRVVKLSKECLVMSFEDVIRHERPIIEISGVRDYSEQLNYKEVESMVYRKIHIPTAPKRLKRIGILVKDYAEDGKVELFEKVFIQEVEVLDKKTIRVKLTRNIFENELDVSILKKYEPGRNEFINIKSISAPSSHEYDIVLEEIVDGFEYGISFKLSETSRLVFGKEYLSTDFKAHVE